MYAIVLLPIIYVCFSVRNKHKKGIEKTNQTRRKYKNGGERI
ncbi:hypothetical protein HMPREF0083_02383 [Aneurinibacillus aneurinilyticus ATCC 12856]|uniref:Uncharacterized protein n=1 Tax=Aneurinibacillus aneurinilyticus ATCC 12856 TaxID=649747 RepID=U1YBQ9_ANEAE|nr:hypothetical protein HMPREF0083_02383 [Aneurinibacillus aneurinilyticus ATCC 12856]